METLKIHDDNRDNVVKPTYDLERLTEKADIDTPATSNKELCNVLRHYDPTAFRLPTWYYQAFSTALGHWCSDETSSFISTMRHHPDPWDPANIEVGDKLMACGQETYLFFIYFFFKFFLF